MIEIPYWVRVVALLSFAAVLILRDRLRDPGNNVRTWEYGCLFLVGSMGAIYGAINDAITVSISPDYFIIGKGLEPGPELGLQAILLGSKAGFSAGVTVCAIGQFILLRIPAPRRCRAILRYSWIPLSLAGTLAVLAPFMFGHNDPFGFTPSLAGFISSAKTTSFLKVWWAHMGAYFGLILGSWMAICLSRRGERTEDPAHCHPPHTRLPWPA